MSLLGINKQSCTKCHLTSGKFLHDSLKQQFYIFCVMLIIKQSGTDICHQCTMDFFINYLNLIFYLNYNLILLQTTLNFSNVMVHIVPSFVGNSHLDIIKLNHHILFMR